MPQCHAQPPSRRKSMYLCRSAGEQTPIRVHVDPAARIVIWVPPDAPSTLGAEGLAPQFGFSRVLAAAGMQAEELEMENALRESAARYAQEAGMDGKDNTGSEVEPEPECCLCPFTAYSVLPCILLPCAISRAPRDVGDQAFRTAQRARCKTLPVTTARRASECPDRGLALLS